MTRFTGSTPPVTQDAKVTANVNKHGKLTSWNLIGFDGPAKDGAFTRVKEGACPSGTLAGSTASQVTTVGPRSGLKVNGIDLPNTPVAPVL